MNIEINRSDLNYKITQQQKAVSVSELLGKCFFVFLNLEKITSVFLSFRI